MCGIPVFRIGLGSVRTCPPLRDTTPTSLQREVNVVLTIWLILMKRNTTFLLSISTLTPWLLDISDDNWLNLLDKWSENGTCQMCPWGGIWRETYECVLGIISITANLKLMFQQPFTGLTFSHTAGSLPTLKNVAAGYVTDSSDACTRSNRACIMIPYQEPHSVRCSTKGLGVTSHIAVQQNRRVVCGMFHWEDVSTQDGATSW